VRCGVFIGGYTVQDTLTPSQPGRPDRERALWYQWYFNTERGRAGLEKNRRALCRLLWEEWSPNWRFTDQVYDVTARSFENPDFVDVTIHSYRHRNGGAAGDPRFADMERQLAARPKVRVPAIVLHGATDGVAGTPPPDTADRNNFTALVDRRVVDGGHFLPRENPGAVASAMLALLEQTR
jgi:pimeloyl-ACP methyl ester carboxylesterase